MKPAVVLYEAQFQFSFACLNAPVGVSCGFNPVSGTLSANGSLTSVLTVSVTAKSSGAVRYSPTRRVWTFFAVAAMILLLTMAMSRGGAIAAGTTWSNGIHNFQWAAGCLLLALALTACGGGGGSETPPSSPPPSSPPPSTPATVVIQVQATSANITQPIGTVTITIP